MRNPFLFIFTIALLTSCTTSLVEINKMGDVYILISKYENDNFTHTLFRLESACFIQEVECPAPESIPTFPKDFASYVWANMYWSPDGKYALFVDLDLQPETGGTVQKLLLYDSKDNSIKTLLSGYKYITGITWNPNNEWAALGIKRHEDKDIQIVLINRQGELRALSIQSASAAGYHPRFFNGQSFDNNQRPIQWLNEDQLVFVRERGEQTKEPGQLPEISIRHFFLFDLTTSVETEIQLPVREASYTFSPNGDFAYFTTYFDKPGENHNIYDLQSGETRPLNLSPNSDAWSPDSKWILTCDRGHETYVISPDLKNRKKIMDGCPIYAIWMPDSDHVILFFLAISKDHSNVEASHWFVASISADTTREIFIPNLELTRVDSMNGIYVQPRKP